MQNVADPELPVLYSFRRCPYAMRARLALAESGVQYALREVVLRNKPAEMLAASPKSTVPVMVLRSGEVIDESLGIMLWALQQNDPKHWLQPQRASVTEMLALIATNDGAFKRRLDRYKYPNRYAQESGGDADRFATTHRDQAASWLSQLESMLGDGWLFGSAPNIADMAILPFARQFAHTDANWFAAQPWPHLRFWLAGFEASSLFAGVMIKQTPWISMQAVDPG